MKRITITDTQGQTTKTTVTDDTAAREYEDLPFKTDDIAIVTVTDD